MCSRFEFVAALAFPAHAVVLLTKLRWPDGVRCVHCGSAAVGGHGSYWRDRAIPRYRCKACGRTFMVTTGTPIARSRVGLMVWVLIFYLTAMGQSALRCAKEAKEGALRYARIYALAWRCIEAAIGIEHERQLEGTVEADEIYVRSGHKGKPHSAAADESARCGRTRALHHGPGRGSAQKDRPVVFILLQRDGGVIVEARGRAEEKTVQGMFTADVAAGSQIYTDSARIYRVVEEVGYPLEQVNHGEKEYARGAVHENGAEGEISLLRPFLLSRRGIAQQNLGAYLKLYQFGRNHRHMADWEQAALLLASMLGNGPAPRRLEKPSWAHDRASCTVGHTAADAAAA
jgi:transposase-like protein